MDVARARSMWQLLEPIHALTYFDPLSIDALRATGLRGFWMTYFAGRAAPMGPVGAPIVEATFFNFSPRLVRRAIPDAWRFAPAERVLEARWAGAAAALEPHVASLAGAAGDRARALLGTATADLCCDGRMLAAANGALEPPDDGLAALWQLVTTLREHRGDGHLAALICAGLSGLEAHLTLVGTGTIPREVLQSARGFDDAEWGAGQHRLVERGLLGDDGTLTDEGAALRREVEGATDRAALEPWARLGDAGCDELAGLLSPVSRAIAGAGVVPVLNPMGLPIR
jgi:hypothetical protein